jgi:hypothetical protein
MLIKRLHESALFKFLRMILIWHFLIFIAISDLIPTLIKQTYSHEKASLGIISWSEPDIDGGDGRW